VEYVREEGRREVKAEGVNLGCLRRTRRLVPCRGGRPRLLRGPLQEVEEPNLEFLFVQHLHNFFLDRHLLQDCKAEALRDTAIGAIGISSDDLEHLVQDSEVMSLGVYEQVINSVYSASHY